MVEYRILITCEHGGHRIPKPYQALFKGHAAHLETHRSYDPGALETARTMADRLSAPLYAADTSRLLVDLNRSIGHPALFSSLTQTLPAAQKEALLAEHYFSHRNPIEQKIGALIAAGRTVLHIACHSFTPVLNGRVRTMDVGLLYDPHREPERLLCRRWRQRIMTQHPDVGVRCNAPYKGVSDGLATHLRKRFAEGYLGIELELNQRTFHQGPEAWRQLNNCVIDGLVAAMS